MKHLKGIIIGTIAVVALSVISPIAVAQPVIPGFERLKEDKTVTLAERGEILLSELNCLSCHVARTAIITRVGMKTPPDLSNAGARLTPQYIREFLNSPHEVKPGTTMPDILHASDARNKKSVIEYLVHFLAAKGGPIKPSRSPVNRSLAEAGKELFHSVGCIACHAPEKSEGITTPIIPLPKQLAIKTTVEELSAFLLDPLHVRKAGRMPRLGLEPGEAKAIAYYLLREQMDNPQAGESKGVDVKGWQYAYHEVSGNKLPDFSKSKAKATGIAQGISINPTGLKRREHQFALRFTANLQIEKKGNYRFWLKSDDGSKLLIDENLIIDNDGVHPANEKRAEVSLTVGSHSIEVQYFEAGGNVELGLLIGGPGFKKAPIPVNVVSVPNQTPMIPLKTETFVIDDRNVQMGAMMMRALRCVSCHNVDNAQPMHPAPYLSQSDLENKAGCLGTEVRKGAPNYRLTDEQRAALKAALADQRKLADPLTPAKRIQKTMAQLNCYACHSRDGIGGPDDKRAEYFHTTVAIDLGEEGKLPPTLNGIGSKLKTEALQSIIVNRKLHVRHYMATRMPNFGQENLATLSADFLNLDRRPMEIRAPIFSEESTRVGHRLAGQNGLSCIACHIFNGSQPAGIPGIDLAKTHLRINPGWFERFLLNPMAINKGTRMPSFFPNGKSALPDVLGGDPKKQIAALWNYLSLGESMATPDGIRPAGGVGDELVPTDRPIIHRTFMTDVGPRSILAGFPEKVHVAFDGNVIRLAKIWRGRFFDGAGVASGRSDKFFGPLGSDVVNMPPGPAFAELASQSDPWPKAEKTDRNIGGSFKGYQLDEKADRLFVMN